MLTETDIAKVKSLARLLGKARNAEEASIALGVPCDQIYSRLRMLTMAIAGMPIPKKGRLPKVTNTHAIAK